MCLVIGSSLIQKRKFNRNDYSLPFIVSLVASLVISLICHSLSLVVILCITCCTTHCHSLSLVFTRRITHLSFHKWSKWMENFYLTKSHFITINKDDVRKSSHILSNHVWRKRAPNVCSCRGKGTRMWNFKIQS